MHFPHTCANNLAKHGKQEKETKTDKLIKALPPTSFRERYHTVHPMMVLNIILSRLHLKNMYMMTLAEENDVEKTEKFCCLYVAYLPLRWSTEG